MLDCGRGRRATSQGGKRVAPPGRASAPLQVIMGRTIVAAAVAILVAAAIAAQASNKKVLYITHSAGYKHEVVPLSMQLLPAIGKKNGFDVIATKDLTFLSPQSLKHTTLWCSTRPASCQSATPTRPTCWQGEIGQGFAAFTVLPTPSTTGRVRRDDRRVLRQSPWHEGHGEIEDAKSPATRHLPAPMAVDRRDLQFKTGIGRSVTCCCRSTIVGGPAAKGVKRTDGDFGLAWTTDRKGRVFYTAPVHRARYGSRPSTSHLAERHPGIVGGIDFSIVVITETQKHGDAGVKKAFGSCSVRLCACVSVVDGVSVVDDPSASPALTRFEFTSPTGDDGSRRPLCAYCASAERAAAAAFARIAGSTPTSATTAGERAHRLTRDAVGRPVAVSGDLFRVLDAAQRLAARTGGAFDITVGPLTQLWRRARRQNELPSPADLAAARAVSRYTLLTLDAKAQTASVRGPASS